MPAPTPHPEEYDVAVLGSGEAGKYIAWARIARERVPPIDVRRRIVTLHVQKFGRTIMPGRKSQMKNSRS